jgi:acyl-CoA hydrolase
MDSVTFAASTTVGDILYITAQVRHWGAASCVPLLMHAYLHETKTIAVAVGFLLCYSSVEMAKEAGCND